MKRRALVPLLAAALSAACWDFVEPDFPEAGAPAVLQIAVVVSDDRNVDVSGVLVPGLDIGGIQRRVENDSITVLGARIGPSEIRRNGTRVYDFGAKLPVALTDPLEITAPAVVNVAGPRPHIRWFGIRKTDADTIAWQRGTDLVLRTATDLGESVPAPQTRQWFLSMQGAGPFNLSADGFPPAELRIPTHFVPAARDGVVRIRLSFFQSGQYSTNTYVGNFSHNVQLTWVVRVSE